MDSARKRTGTYFIALALLLALTSLAARGQGLYSWRDEDGINHLTQDLPPTTCKSNDCNRLQQQHLQQVAAEARRQQDEAARKREEVLLAKEKQLALEREQAQQKESAGYFNPGKQVDMALGEGQIKCFGKGILWANADGIFGINGTGRDVARRQGWKDGTAYFAPETLQRLLAQGKIQCGI